MLAYLERISDETEIIITVSGKQIWCILAADMRGVLLAATEMNSLKKSLKRASPVLTDRVAVSVELSGWEYNYTPFNTTLNYINHFNKKGAEGWELITCDFNKEIAIFKRPI
jgi:hypothetical protein